MAHNRRNKVIARILTIVIVTLLQFSGIFADCGFSGTCRTVRAAEEIDGHAYVAESDAYRLYMKEEDLSLVVENKETGAYMESAISYDDGKNNDSWLGAMKSAIVMTMINGNDDTQQADLINDNVNKNITFTDNGFSAELYWTKYQFGLTLEVSITNDGVVANIPDASIHEDGTNYYIGTIALYPYMGNSYLDEKEGYIFVPDGNGALIYLDDKEGRFKSGFSGMIYGGDIGLDESDVTTLLMDRYNTISDAEKVIAPVFGIAHTDDQLAFLGIVEDGEARATIECIPNGVSVDYNRAFAKFILRKTYTQPTSNNSTAGSLHIFEAERSHSDLRVRYMFLSGDDADYSGMASAYRTYLQKEGHLQQADTSYNTRIDFLGEERESFVLGTSSVVMTDTDAIREIYEDLKSEEVTDILSVYKGWQKGGLYSLPIDSFKVSSGIGGAGALLDLMSDCKDQGIDLYLYNNALLINPDEKNATFNVVKKINKRRYEMETYMDVYETLLYLTPQRSEELLNRYIKASSKKGVSNLALAGVSQNLFSYTYREDTYSRFDTQDTYSGLVSEAAGSTELILEQPFAYLWEDTKAFLDMPLYTSSYIFEDESIPFLSLVLKGSLPIYAEYVNFEANKQEFFLKMVESGSYPSFYITKESSAELIYTNSCDIYSSEYSSYKETIAQYNRELSELSHITDGAVIEQHEILEKDLVKVTYSNGTKIYINYGSGEKEADGISIPSMSYEVSR
ncbi:MAG: hypothetical protein K5682_00890 [Lachnospiraceae bacterium]|nr:hypothetical protein [Lachnospiraceae bacterium]